MRELGPGRPLYAFDTLGYGESDKPPWSDAEISDYADVVLAAAADLGLDEFDLYGTLTGGTIALETVIRAPERVRRLVLGSLSVFPDERLPELLERYAPPQKLRDDGALLRHVWNQVKDLGAFWPWYDRTNPMNEWDAWPPAVVQGLVTEVLKAGRSYHIATQASFRYPKRERLPEVPTETLLTTSANRPRRVHRGGRVDDRNWRRWSPSTAPGRGDRVLPGRPGGLLGCRPCALRLRTRSRAAARHPGPAPFSPLEGARMSVLAAPVPAVDVVDLARSSAAASGARPLRAAPARRRARRRHVHDRPRRVRRRSSAGTAPASRRSSACSRRCCCTTAASARVFGHDVVRRRRAPCAGSSTASRSRRASSSG